MIKINFDENSYEIPSSFAELKIKHFEKFIEVSLRQQSKDLSVQYKDVIIALTDMTEDEFYSLGTDTFNNICKDISFLGDTHTSEMIDEIEIDGVVYKYKKNKDGSYFNMRQTKLIQDATVKNPHKNLGETAAILFHPIDENGEIVYDYSEEGIAKRAEVFREKASPDLINPYMLMLGDYYSKLIQNATKNMPKTVE